MDPSRARALWQRLETINAVTYFAPECRAANTTVGLRGFWMGYFAARACPMGAVSAGVVEATFYNFHPAMVRKAIPDASKFAAPDAILAARSDSAARAIGRLAPADASSVDRLLPRLHDAIGRASGTGRALFAANRDVEVHGGLASLWQAATTLREHRGDGHVALLTEAGLDGCETHVLFAATEGVPPELLQESRGWSVADWDAAVARLHARGLLARAAGPTESGRSLRRDIERRTDELAVQPYEALGAAGVDRLLETLDAIAGPIAGSGEIPFPNPMGLPPSTEGRAN